MATFITIVIVVVALAVFIAFLQRFYRKATRETALIRTGFGGQKGGDGRRLHRPALPAPG